MCAYCLRNSFCSSTMDCIVPCMWAIMSPCDATTCACGWCCFFESTFNTSCLRCSVWWSLNCLYRSSMFLNAVTLADSTRAQLFSMSCIFLYLSTAAWNARCAYTNSISRVTVATLVLLALYLSCSTAAKYVFVPFCSGLYFLSMILCRCTANFSFAAVVDPTFPSKWSKASRAVNTPSNDFIPSVFRSLSRPGNFLSTNSHTATSQSCWIS
mmetsp:Transcript_11060/g.23450  ORF Transcript_11060/g.23450 Transcript_11060/m.23450 type:complete len:212 (-) Transcript_11060:536-1171(-)